MYKFEKGLQVLYETFGENFVLQKPIAAKQGMKNAVNITNSLVEIEYTDQLSLSPF